MSQAPRYYGPHVILPRRIKADLIDGIITAAILFVPLLAGQLVSDTAPEAFLRLFWLAIPAASIYSVFRDALAGGTSLGKRALGLRIIALEDGRPCGARRVWARDLLDPIPIVGLVDFIWMCVDRHGQKLMDRLLATQLVEQGREERNNPR